MKNRSLPLLNLLLSLCACVALAACGGGGSSSSSSSGGGTTATTPQPSATIVASASTVTSGQSVTLTWSSQNTGATGCTASGGWTGTLAASGSQQVTPAATAGSTVTYGITCGTATNSVAVTVAAPANTLAVTVDAGPTNSNAFNIPFVSVTVCRPGTTTCQTIDHIMVDTGSYGLRLIAPIDSTLALPAVTSSSGAAVGECGQFVSGYTWGSVVQADIKLAGETASGQSIQIIGQAPAGVTKAPTDCTSTGSNIGTVAALGANGVLGVGLFKQDCGNACVSRAVSATYYACANGSCTGTAMPLAQQVTNPVAGFATDNNGIILSMPAVSTGGAKTLTGTLTFGIGTQVNNALGSATKFKANSSGNFVTVYKGTRMASSFIDSGSNGLFFNDSSITTCKTSTGFYCPTSPLSLSATIESYDGSTSATVPFILESVDALGNDVVAAWVGGSSGKTSTFDWGLPFFFGRKVYVGLESATADPYWAY